MIEDAAKMSVQRAAKEYDKGADISPELAQKVYAFMSKLRTLPTEYFEAKILRAVDTAEFKVAVVPDNTADVARKYLESRGVVIVEYKAGDDADRAAKIKQAAEDNDALFSRDAAANTERSTTPSSDPQAQAKAQSLNDALVGYFGKEWSNSHEAIELPDSLSGIRQEIEAAFGRDVQPVVVTVALNAG